MRNIVFYTSLYMFFILQLVLFPFSAFSEIIPFPKTSYEIIGKNNIKQNPEEVLFVVIDQTVSYDNNIKYKTIDLVKNWINYGKAVEVYSFSSAVPGLYTQKITGGRIDDIPNDEFLDNLNRSISGRFVVLHENQRVIAGQSVVKAILSIFNEKKESIPHSDIIRTMKEISLHVKNYKSNRKNILIVSDMLENSTIASFYSNGRVKLINDKSEIENVAKCHMFGDYGINTHVYILGLGFFDKNLINLKNEKYLDPMRINKIKIFWEKYFSQSRSALVEIGSPMLFGSIK
jgi:hypothetical protein